ncbi:ribonuclease Z [Bacillus coahuilensis m2-6]|uniref:Ribonuclease Z n=1 Tax=Bacillus coahuilensis p1.1.43 TaxID=1150625 RepID=A0A147KAB4_9BACI|nr:YvrJ family protein [Bacillus coahuilensis]KUP07626.1 ribonuclease Z [Bacillus coahuilensis p1.1.43]KUP08772.1 ribonuclease Z [Bacillus coahuilensis m2-6]
MNEIAVLLSEVGFPVVVTLYLLHRIEAKLEAVITSIQTLSERLSA